MTLTADEFAEVLKALGATRTASDPKRRAMRVVHRCKAPIIMGLDAAEAPAGIVTVRDFSPRGVCILYDKPLATGSNFVMELARRRGNAVRILCTVAHCRSINNAMHQIGAEFTCIITEPPLRRPADKNAVDRVRDSVLSP